MNKCGACNTEFSDGTFHSCSSQPAPAASGDGELELLRRLSELQDKLLVCYRVGTHPGAWLSEMPSLREQLARLDAARRGRA